MKTLNRPSSGLADSSPRLFQIPFGPAGGHPPKGIPNENESIGRRCSALSLSSHAQQPQIADSTGGRQTAGVGIDQAAIYGGINDARGRAQNAQGMAEWAGQTAQSASQVAAAAQGTASYAVGRAADARARADYTAWYNWNYTRATAISNCMATGGNPVYCSAMADTMYPAP